MLILFTGRTDTKEQALVSKQTIRSSKGCVFSGFRAQLQLVVPSFKVSFTGPLEPFMCHVHTYADFTVVLWDDHQRVDPGGWILHWFNYSHAQQFCGLISALSSQIKWYPSIRLCNRFYSEVYIQGYLFVSNTSGYCCFKLSALLVTKAMLMPPFNTPSSVAVILPSSDIPLP